MGGSTNSIVRNPGVQHISSLWGPSVYAKPVGSAFSHAAQLPPTTVPYFSNSGMTDNQSFLLEKVKRDVFRDTVAVGA